jgi:hypothetical protein
VRYRVSEPGGLQLNHDDARSHPVRRRPTHRGAGVVRGVQVERATVRTTWTPRATSARLCLGRWRTGWELPRAHHYEPGRGDSACLSAITRRRRPSGRLVKNDAWLITAWTTSGDYAMRWTISPRRRGLDEDAGRV